MCLLVPRPPCSYVSTRDALEALYPRLAPGGFVYVDDYGSYTGGLVGGWVGGSAAGWGLGRRSAAGGAAGGAAGPAVHEWMLGRGAQRAASWQDAHSASCIPTAAVPRSKPTKPNQPDLTSPAGCQRAVHEFRLRRGITAPLNIQPMPEQVFFAPPANETVWGAAWWVKDPHEAFEPGPAATAAAA